MADRVTNQPDEAAPPQENEAVPVLITFALLFLLSAAVWFVLDRIRSDEVQSQISQSGTRAPANSVHPSKVAATK